MSGSWRPKWQNFRHRNWETVRDSWVGYVPEFRDIGARPDPGLEDLEPLLQTPLDKPNGRYPDVPGLRTNNLWEAVFLFHKCSHTSLAAQRIAQLGMHSWCLFNAYHSAYLGAKGIMALLGVAFPNLRSRQVALDLCPEPEGRKRPRALGSPAFEEFLIVPLPPLDQRRVWEAFQRVLNVTESRCWDTSLRQEILNLDYEQITPPRNRFLYKAHYWPLEDLASDASPTGLEALWSRDLDVGAQGFLLSLSLTVYSLFEQLMSDLAGYSRQIKEQFDASRCRNRDLPELDPYKKFAGQAG